MLCRSLFHLFCSKGTPNQGVSVSHISIFQIYSEVTLQKRLNETRLKYTLFQYSEKSRLDYALRGYYVLP